MGRRIQFRVRATKRFKIMQCGDCGTDLKVGANSRPPKRCPACSEAIFIENLTQIVGKSGPYYDHWMQRTIEGLSRLPRPGGPSESIGHSAESDTHTDDAS